MVLFHRKVRRRSFLSVVAVAVLLLLLITFVQIAVFPSKLHGTDERSQAATTVDRQLEQQQMPQQQQQHQLCVTIPYRDRWTELQQMLPLLHKFLATTQAIVPPPRYIVVNQSEEDALRFNRAALINIGALEAERVGCDYMAIHDVDIVPLNPNLSYHYPEDGHIMHVAAGQYHPIQRYDYKNFIGSVLVITLADFKKVNGMSNEFWGWGLEDDDFYLRLKAAGMANKIQRPSNLSTNRSNTFLHLHTRSRRRDFSVDEYKKKRRRKRNTLSGLRTLNYKLNARHTIELTEDIQIWVLDLGHFYFFFYLLIWPSFPFFGNSNNKTSSIHCFSRVLPFVRAFSPISLLVQRAQQRVQVDRMDLTPEEQQELYNAYNRPNVPEDLTEEELAREVHLGAYNQATQMRHALSTTDLSAEPLDISIALPFTPENMLHIREKAIKKLRSLPLRTYDVHVHGSTSAHEPPHFEEVPALYSNYLTWLNTEIEKVQANDREGGVLRFAAEAHTKLVKAHVWGDGNGRTARAVTNIVLKHCQQHQVSFETVPRPEYMRAVGDALDGNPPKFRKSAERVVARC
ncbi:hypothetical protein niasHS_016680 [Heterodera schachtii]|uniref:Fido domain-containing protein n=1 Tax=Heterodera schachtii TaxID=97005 RepID=A0ABD2I1Y6_HETSC